VLSFEIFRSVGVGFGAEQEMVPCAAIPMVQLSSFEIFEWSWTACESRQNVSEKTGSVRFSSDGHTRCQKMKISTWITADNK
jgi:hypothetical protein